MPVGALYAGLALFILPNPGGGIPQSFSNFYRDTTPLGLPLAFLIIAIILLTWGFIQQTRYGRYLFAVGGKADAAYETAVPVSVVQFSTYVIAGLMAAISGIAITMFETAIEALFRHDYALAESIVEKTRDVVSLEKEAVTTSQKMDIADAPYLRLIIESIRRTAEYASDIAEIVLNLTIESVLS